MQISEVINPNQNEGGKLPPLPYQFSHCNFYKRLN